MSFCFLFSAPSVYVFLHKGKFYVIIEKTRAHSACQHHPCLGAGTHLSAAVHGRETHMTNDTSLCYVVGAMPLDPGFILTPVPGDLVIAADKGYETLSRLGVHPGLVVGDFDSLGSVPDHPQVLRLPRIKDETDTGFALRQGLKRGYRRFVLLGCLGGRLDHTVANLQLLSWLSAQGAQGVLLGEGEAAAVVTEGTLSFPASMEGFVSVFCAGGTARGVTLEGLKYPLDHAELTSDFPLGVSNEFVGLPARISVQEGSLLVAWEDRGTLDDLLPTLWSD